MPMSLHTHPMPDDPTLMAFMYGPLVLAGQLGGGGLTDENTHTKDNWYKFAKGLASVSPLIVDADSVTDCVKPVPGKRLTFTTIAGEKRITLVPYHKLFDQRYAIYWRVLRKGSPEHKARIVAEKKRKAMLARTVDTVLIAVPESERAHNLKAEQSKTGEHGGLNWRDAAPGGWFSYEFKVLGDRAMTLLCTFWGSDVGRTFDIMADGKKIAAVTLNNNVPGEFFEQQYDLPFELMRGKDKVTVKFQGRQGSLTGGLFGCAMLKDDQAPAEDQHKQAYLFSSFRGDGEDGLHLAYSYDGYKWTNLGKTFLTPEVGESRLMRDPCIIQGPDGKFHMVWTAGWWEKGIGYANSNDLINWSKQKYIEVMAHEPEARNCWAPEVFYDEAEKQYLIFWATTIPGRFPDTEQKGDHNHRIYYVTTPDFESFSKTRLFYDHGFNVIDSTIVRDGGRYLMFLKDETRNPPQKNIRLATAARAEGPYSAPSEPITGRYWAEGPTAIKIGDTWFVYFDKYTEHNYGVVVSEDLKNWNDLSDRLVFPKGSRHGTVLKASGDILERLFEDR
ncbi:MAG: family 43 glycosylhydrolase [Sedimentisphaerales bacterium]|nr:family 43 glycosylhydrolase [Sedimentisphaerales bacterium]